MRTTLLVASVFVCLFLSLNPAGVGAQSSNQKFEVGVQFSLLRQGSNVFKRSDLPRWDPGFGGRFTYDLSRFFSLEAELNFFPRQDDFVALGRKTQGLFGVKAGRRGSTFGLFGKARPGFVRFSNIFDCPGADKPSCGDFAKTEFAMDVGGVLEYYPSPRIVVRFDAGDTIIRFSDTTEFPFFPEFPSAPVRREGRTVNNFQLNIGIGFRF